MRRIICAAVVAAILLSGCGNSSALETELSPEVLTEAQAIAPDKVYDLPELFFAGSALVYGDRYAVCEMETQEFAAEVYDLKEGKVVGKLLHYGNGPQEVIFPSFAMHDNTLQVLDVQKQKIFIIPCDVLPDAEVVREQDLSFTSFSVISCGDSLISLNPYYFENDEMGIHNGEPLLFYTDGKEVPYDKSKPRSLNVVQGPLTWHSGDGNVVFANMVESEIFFLDKELAVYRRITGPKHDKIDYVNVGGELVFSGMNSNTYLDACSDREYVYLLYDGRHYSVYDEELDWEYTDHDLYLFQMDWDGHLKGIYALEGVRYVGPRLSCGSQPGTVYVSAVSPDEGNLQIFYYDLRKYN